MSKIPVESLIFFRDMLRYIPFYQYVFLLHFEWQGYPVYQQVNKNKKTTLVRLQDYIVVDSVEHS